MHETGGWLRSGRVVGPRHHRVAATTVVPGGWKTTTTSREPHLGHRSRVSKRDSGKARPRVHTSVSTSRSRRKVQGRLDLALGPSARPDAQRAVTRQPWDSASPIVSTIMREQIKNM